MNNSQKKFLICLKSKISYRKNQNFICFSLVVMLGKYRVAGVKARFVLKNFCLKKGKMKKRYNSLYHSQRLIRSIGLMINFLWIQILQENKFWEMNWGPLNLQLLKGRHFGIFYKILNKATRFRRIF